MRARGIAAIALVGVLAACASQQGATTQEKSRIELANEQLVAELDQCSARHDTDPRTATVGENELAPREREWRACAYEGIRAILVPASAVPEVYDELIAEDEALTDQVEAGEITRTERRARLDQLREEIAAKEARATEQPRSAAERGAEIVRQLRGLP